MKYLILKSEGKFSFRIICSDCKTIESYLQKANTEERELIENLSSLDFDPYNEILLFRNSENKVGLIGKSFEGWAEDTSKSLSIRIFENPSIDKIKILNMHPAKGEGFGTISFISDKTQTEMIIFFLKANYYNWDDKFEETKYFISEIESFLEAKKVNKISKFYNS